MCGPLQMYWYTSVVLLNSFCCMHVEKIWAKRLQQWKTEKESCKKLEQDVLETRKKQIEHKCELLSVAKRSVLQVLLVWFSFLPTVSVFAMQRKEEEQETQVILKNIEENKVLEEQQEQQRKQVSQLWCTYKKRIYTVHEVQLILLSVIQELSIELEVRMYTYVLCVHSNPLVHTSMPVWYDCHWVPTPSTATHRQRPLDMSTCSH